MPQADYRSCVFSGKSLEVFQAAMNITYRRCLLGDWEKGKRRWLWASEAQLDKTNTTLEWWLNLDQNSGQSQSMEDLQDDVYCRVQQGGETISKLKTVHTDGKPYTLDMTYSPMVVQFQDMEEEKTVFFVDVSDVHQQGGDADRQLAMGADLLQHSETIVAMFDAASESLEFGNQKWNRFYEYQCTVSASRRTQAGLTLNDLFACIRWDSEQQRDQIISAIRSLSIGDEKVDVECRMNAASNTEGEPEELWHQIHFIPAKNPVSSALVIVVTQTDVSKMRKQDRALLEAQRQQAMARQREEFFSAVSHELRTPLNGIIGLSEGLLQHADVSDTILRTLKLIKTSGQRLSALVNDILDASAARRGRFVIKREMVLLHEVAEAVCDMMQEMLPGGLHLLNCIEHRSVPPMEGDSSRLNQILVNLLSNAIKFTQHGSITLRARLLSDEEVVVEVEDCGCGIPRDKWAQIWQAFQQVDMSTTRKYGGTGLGLALVKEMVEAHNGRVGLDSSSDGSTFFMVLPVKQPGVDSAESETAGSRPLLRSEVKPGVLSAGKAGASRAASSGLTSESEGASATAGTLSAAEKQDLQGVCAVATRTGGVGMAETDSVRARAASVTPVEEFQRVEKEVSGWLGEEGDGRCMHSSEIHGKFEILSVDDHQVNHVVVENSLAPKGYTITTCMSASEALELLDTRGYLPDLILLDCMMPGMSGYDMCSKLREKFPCNTLPVIMVSAKSHEADVVKALQAGCNDYISKPFGALELNERIDVQFKMRHLWNLEIIRAVSNRSPLLRPATPEAHRAAAACIEGAVHTHSSVSILVCDIQNLFDSVHSLPSKQLSSLMGKLLDRFDAVARAEQLTRMIDDAYMLVLEDESLDRHAHAVKILRVAERLLDEASQLRVSGHALHIRFGLSWGTAHSGLVGIKHTKYCFWGQAVRDAVDVTECCPAGCVLVTAELADGLQDRGSWLEQYARRRRTQSDGADGQGLPESACPWVYLARLGRFEDELGALERGGAGKVLVKPETEEFELSPLNQCLAWLRAVEVGERELDVDVASESSCGPEEEAKECQTCQATTQRCEELQFELNQAKVALKKATEDRFKHELARTPSMVGNRDVPARGDGSISVLSVDDDPVNQMVVENLLAPLGYTVHACMNGIEALQFLRREAPVPNLVLLDVMMPHMSGYEVCRELRLTWNRAELPIIMVSGKGGPESVVEGLEAGCNDYVSKPFDRVELLARISTQLRLAEAGAAERDNAETNKLLDRLLPTHVIQQIRRGQTVIREEHQSVSVLVARIPDYAELSASLHAAELLAMFNEMVDTLEDLAHKHSCSVADVSADSIVVVAGHDGRADSHAECVVKMGLSILAALTHVRHPREPSKPLELRVGIHSGKGDAGVLGTRLLRYKFFGSCMVGAQLMEATGFANNIQLSKATSLLLPREQWDLELLGSCPLPGAGPTETFLVKQSPCDWTSALTANTARGQPVKDSSAAESIKQVLAPPPARAGSRTAAPTGTGQRRWSSAASVPASTERTQASPDTREASESGSPSPLHPQALPSPAHGNDAGSPHREGRERASSRQHRSREGGVVDAHCVRCQEKAARLEDCSLAVESLTADNSKLVSMCANLAEQVRVTSTALSHRVSGHLPRPWLGDEGREDLEHHPYATVGQAASAATARPRPEVHIYNAVVCLDQANVAAPYQPAPSAPGNLHLPRPSPAQPGFPPDWPLAASAAARSPSPTHFHRAPAVRGLQRPPMAAYSDLLTATSGYAALSPNSSDVSGGRGGVGRHSEVQGGVGIEQGRPWGAVEGHSFLPPPPPPHEEFGRSSAGHPFGSESYRGFK